MQVAVIKNATENSELLEFLGISGDHELNDWHCINGTASVLVNNGLNYYAIRIKKRAARAVVHECVHMAQFIFEDKGIPTDVGNTEALAYMVDYLYSETMRILKGR